MQKERERFFEISNDMLCLVGYDRYFKQLNPSWTRVLGWSLEELKSRPFLEFVHPEDREPTLAAARKMMSGSDVVSFENRYVCRDGSYKWLSWSLSLSSREELFYGAARDVTRDKSVEKMKNEVIALVTHELRSPLSSIMISLGVVRDALPPESDPMLRKMADVAHRNCERLKNLINDYLDLEKIESGKASFDIQPLELVPFLEETIEMNQAYAAQFGVRYVLSKTEDGLSLPTDGVRLAQVLTNLLSNAAKFSPSGAEVSISVERRDGAVRIAVSDCGPGIPESFLPMLFQKFSQRRMVSEPAKKGSGLGLSISKAIVEKLGGEIGVESDPGVRTTFHFTLPLRPA
jgi:PAS domain S-box-containing protein